MNGIANILLVAVSGIENIQHRGTIAGLGGFCDETSPVGAKFTRDLKGCLSGEMESAEICRLFGGVRA
jgi:hypothetical protein